MQRALQAPTTSMRGRRPTSASTATWSSCRATGCSIETVQNCWDRAHRARMVTLRMRPKPVDSTREHLDVVDKIRAGDARGAFDAHRAHRERGSRELLAILERYRLQQL